MAAGTRYFAMTRDCFQLPKQSQSAHASNIYDSVEEFTYKSWAAAFGTVQRMASHTSSIQRVDTQIKHVEIFFIRDAKPNDDR
jgi:hypothetical protein